MRQNKGQGHPFQKKTSFMKKKSESEITTVNMGILSIRMNLRYGKTNKEFDLTNFIIFKCIEIQIEYTTNFSRRGNQYVYLLR